MRISDWSSDVCSSDLKLAHQRTLVASLVDLFEPGKRYTERAVTDLLDQRHTFRDPARLRRYLYDWRYLDRTSDGRSAERRVGKVCVRTCDYRLSPYL